MKKISKNTLYILLSLMVIGCSKDDDTTTEDEQTTQKKLKSLQVNDSYLYKAYYLNNGMISGFLKEHLDTGFDEADAQYQYNANNQPTKKGEAVYTYNTEGEISTITTPVYTSDLTFNENGELIQEESAVAYGNSTVSRTFVYDTQGLLTEIKQHFVSNTLAITPYKKYLITYNNQNNITKVLIKHSADDSTYIDRYVITFGYDDKNNPVTGLHESIGGSSGILSHYMGTLHYYSDNLIVTDTPRLYYYGKNNLLFYTSTDLSDNKEYKTTYKHSYSTVVGEIVSTTQTIYNPNSNTSDEIKYEYTYEE